MNHTRGSSLGDLVRHEEAAFRARMPRPTELWQRTQQSTPGGVTPDVHTAISHCHFLVQHNGGVFLPPWGKSESWTLSVAHCAADGERYVADVARLGQELVRISRRSSEIFAEGAYS